MFLKDINVNYKFFLKIINLLNMTKVYINYDLFLYISSHIENSQLYKLIKNNLNYEFLKKNSKSIEGSYQYFCNYTLIKNQVELIKNNSSGYFYNSYMFDSRYRIYVTQ